MDRIVERKDQKEVIARILRMHNGKKSWQKEMDEADRMRETAARVCAREAAGLAGGKPRGPIAPFSGEMRVKTLNKIADRQQEAWDTYFSREAVTVLCPVITSESYLIILWRCTATATMEMTVQ